MKAVITVIGKDSAEPTNDFFTPAGEILYQ